ncbi:hypothetical protein DYU11_18350 [Fibrisoma montanum]|uniref:Uncharacterized protein n=1 Tax=Fibrisoma montanum TaxID=2305895 RepID=A0A418M5Z5_9BACT|nr:hypothetical protein [Fibrisoma montanum]RIV21368.1 hypothetical protein DYU11_18350 [Fibrisoma montanum]
MAKLTIKTGPAQQVSIPARSERPVTVTRPGHDGPDFTLPITNTADLVIRKSEHKIAHVSGVTVTNENGAIILTDIRIDPETDDVYFHSSKPLTGFIIIF